MTSDITLDLLRRSSPLLQNAFPGFPGVGTPEWPEANLEKMAAILEEAAKRMGDNYPYFHPLYAGQMLKPPHPLARAAYALAMYLNPNNHALDGGRASSRMEIEAVREIAGIFGWTEFLGHLTSGGTFANLEALWIARELAPGKRVAASEQAHHTHRRISSVLGMPFVSVAVDDRGRMDLHALEAMLDNGDIGTVVVTLGTTATGAVDPLDRVLALRGKYEFRIHADAAYGGYFALTSNLAEDAAKAFASLPQADSIVVDPHKHGLQPYGCGCILFRDPSVGRFYKHDSPYTYFTSQDLHLGEISLECSRAGASAVALWATQQLLPLVRGGEFAAGLSACRQAAVSLHERISADRRFLTPFPPELDILTWTIAAPNTSQASQMAREAFAAAAEQGLHLALTELPAKFFSCWRGGREQQCTVTCLRSVLMKPEHLDWLDTIWSKLVKVVDEVLARANP